MGRNKEKEKVKDAKRSRVLNEKGNIYQKTTRNGHEIGCEEYEHPVETMGFMPR